MRLNMVLNPSDETCFLRFSMVLDAGQLIVDCRNSIPDGTPIESGGVGLTNLERRLYLLFGNNVSLKVDPSENEESPSHYDTRKERVNE